MNPASGNLVVAKKMTRFGNFRSLSLKMGLFFCLLGAAILSGTPNLVFAADATWSTAYSSGVEALNEQDLKVAEEEFKKALSLVESQSRRPEDTENCMLKLADTLTLEYKTEEARILYEKLLSKLTARYGSTSSHLAPVLVALGSIEESEGNHEMAMNFYSRAFHMYEKNYGPYSPAFTSTLHRLAITAYKSGHKKEAERRYKQANSILQQEPGLHASKQLESLTREYGDLLNGADNSNQDLIRDFQKEVLGEGGAQANSAIQPKREGASDRLKPQEQDVPDDSTVKLREGGQQTPNTHLDRGSYWEQQSEILHQNISQGQTDENARVALRSTALPASQSTLSPAYKIVNDTIFNQNHYEKTEAYNKRMIATDIEGLGAKHPSVANDLTGLAQLYIGQQRYAEAQPLLERALSIYVEAYGKNSLLAINTMSTLASVESHLGHNEEAAQLCRDALSNGQQIIGPNSAETARILNQLANVYFRQGQLAEACTIYQWAIASTEAALGKDSPLLAASLKDYAQVLRSLGREDDALAVESRATKILASSN